jgi:YD repeat-containing protein
MARFGGAASAVAMLVALSTSADGQAQSVQTGYTYDVHGRLVTVIAAIEECGPFSDAATPGPPRSYEIDVG